MVATVLFRVLLVCTTSVSSRNHVQKVLARVNTITGIAYRDDPTVMAWELMNEPCCQVDYSGNTVDEWVQEMAPYVKSIDNKHLLAVGMEGFYRDSVPDRKQYNPGYQVGTDFIKSNLVKEIDFGTIHAYPDVWYDELFHITNYTPTCIGII
ncbi:hypothetical protein CRG98_038445 [Punica granatum]|uniref:mannan endo-1,4-beta-mannosidase n=1 Tax=Punica granatum TaxID=22663 RepID=A0A2I0IBX3_PUNGR|nr:hypothetical protein CRG98_038445 [Punica granatum]